VTFLFVGLGLLEHLGLESVGFSFSEELDALSLNGFARLLLLTLDSLESLIGFLSNFSLQQVDLLDILIVLKGH
jgi:hypothetical protein